MGSVDASTAAAALTSATTAFSAFLAV